MPDSTRTPSPRRPRSSPRQSSNVAPRGSGEPAALRSFGAAPPQGDPPGRRPEAHPCRCFPAQPAPSSTVRTLRSGTGQLLRPRDGPVLTVNFTQRRPRGQQTVHSRVGGPPHHQARPWKRAQGDGPVMQGPARPAAVAAYRKERCPPAAEGAGPGGEEELFAGRRQRARQLRHSLPRSRSAAESSPRAAAAPSARMSTGGGSGSPSARSHSRSPGTRPHPGEAQLTQLPQRVVMTQGSAQQLEGPALHRAGREDAAPPDRGPAFRSRRRPPPPRRPESGFTQLLWPWPP